MTEFSPVEQLGDDIPLLLGCYQQDDSVGIYVVNNNLEKTGCVTIAFRKKVRGQLIHLDGNDTFHTQQLSFSLNSGAAAYLQLF